MNPWHDIPVGDNPPHLVNAIIEIPKGSKGKFEIHKPSGGGGLKCTIRINFFVETFLMF